jgi:hypothetical protein
MLVSSIIGFVPAVFILYLLLRRYEEYLGEKNIFLAFAVGLILGMIITVFHLVSDDFILAFLDLSLLVYVVMFALFEEAAKLVILNLPRLHLKYETTYYGAGLGLGIGSMAIVAISFKLFLDNPSALGNPLTLFGLFVLSFNYCLLHSSTGVIIGFGCAKGYVFHLFIWAVIAHAAYNLILLPFMWGVAFAYGSLFLATIFVIFLFWYVLREIMPEAVPPEMQKKKRREVRKRVRERKKAD